MRCDAMGCDAKAFDVMRTRCDAMRWGGRGEDVGGGGEDEREFEVPHLLFLQWGCVADAAAFSNIWQCLSLMGLLMRFMVPLTSDGLSATASSGSSALQLDNGRSLSGSRL